MHALIFNIGPQLQSMLWLQGMSKLVIATCEATKAAQLHMHRIWHGNQLVY